MMWLPRWRRAARAGQHSDPRNKRRKRTCRGQLRIGTFEERIVPSAIVWSGSGGDGLWATAANWTGGVVPGAGDDAVIDNSSPAGTVSVASNNAVHSLSCTKPFTIASGVTFTVSAAASASSSVGGSLTVKPGAVLIVSGGTSFTATGTTAIDGASFYAQSGGSIHLPAASSYTFVAYFSSVTFQATGAGSVLDLGNLTTLTNDASVDRQITISAQAGGHVDLHQVASFIDPTTGNTYGRNINVTADGSGSLVDLSALVNFQDQNPFGNNFGGYSSLTAHNGGTIASPTLTTLGSVMINLDGTGTMPVSQVQTLFDGALNISGAAISFPSLNNVRSTQINVSGVAANLGSVTNLSDAIVTLSSGGTADLHSASNIDGASFVVSGGVTLSLPAASSYTFVAYHYGSVTFQATGAGSVLDLGNLTTLTNDASVDRQITISAQAGGHINLHQAASFIDPTAGNTYGRNINVTADGSGSLVDLSALVNFQDQNPFANNFGGYSSLTARNGGTIACLNLTTLGSVSVNLDGTGTLPVSQMQTLLDGILNISGTAVSFPALTNVRSTQINVSGVAANLGSVTNLSDAIVTLSSGGTADLHSASNIDGASFLVSGDVTLSLPAASSYTFVAYHYGSVTFQATGAGSVLDLGNLTTLTNDASVDRQITISAQAGGHVDLHQVASFIDPTSGNTYGRNINVTADGSGSQVDLSALVNFQDQNPFGNNFGGYSSLTARNGGTIACLNLTTLGSVVVTLDGTGTMPVAQMQTLFDGALNISGAAVSFPNLNNVRSSQLNISGVAANLGSVTNLRDAIVTLSSGGTADLHSASNIDGASFLVSGGVTLSLPAASSYTFVAYHYGSVTFQATGAGSVLDLGNLTTLTNDASVDRQITISAQAGGRVDLHQVASFIDPTAGNTYGRNINVTADGSGSLVDLSALVNFQDQNPFANNVGGYSSLTVRNSGVIGTGALVCTNVIVSIGSGSTLNGSLDLQTGSYLRGAGTLNGNVINRATVQPGGAGATGLLTITGLYTQTSTGTLNVELGGTVPGTQYDRLAVAGNDLLDGTLNISLINSYLPNNGDNFQVLTFAGRSGDFAVINGEGQPGQRVLTPGYAGTALTLTTYITANQPPVLNPIPNMSVDEEIVISSHFTATDPDAGQTITYSLVGAPPPGFSLLGSQGTFIFVGNDGPAAYTVTVRATDNGVPNLSDTKSFVIQVNNVPPDASISAPSDGFQGVPGQGRDFVVGAFDQSPTDQAAGFTYHIHWGDGSPDQVVTGPDGTHVGHVFASTGTYTVSVVATDKDGGDSQAITRQVTIVTSEMQNGTLAVGGTSGNDTFNVTPGAASGDLSVTLNGTPLGTFSTTGQAFFYGVGGAGDVLSYNDGGSTTGHTYTITDTSLTRSSGVTVGYDGFESLVVTAGSAIDTFNVQATAAATPLTINAGSGNDSINLGSTGNALDSLQGAVTINGGVGTDTVKLNDQGAAAGQTYTLTSTTLTRGSLPAITYATAEKLLLNGAADSTLAVVSTLKTTPMTFTGAGSNNTLIGPNVANTWTFTGADAGKVGTITFSNVQNLTGGTGTDSFKFGSLLTTISGVIDGGAGTNKLDYTTYGAAVNYSLQDPGVAPGTGGVANIRSLVGNPHFTNTLTGPAAGGTWNITNTNAGNIAGFTFTNVQSLTGGPSVDVFKFTNAKTIGGSVNGGGGGDWLDYAAWTTAISVNLNTGSATAVAGGISNIQNVRAGSGGSNLTGDSQGNILVGGAGNDVLTAGSGRSILIGGKGSDTVVGGTEQDVLIGGTTSYDTNNTALASLLAEWQRTDATFAERVADLQSGGGLNGTSKLVFNNTVKDDTGAADTLTGNGGLDWFFQFAGDNLTDFQAGEQLN